MKADNQEVLSDVFIEIAGKFAFMFGEKVGQDELPDADDDDLIRAHLDFKGQLTGTLDIAVPIMMCRELAGNVLGLADEELTPDASKDAIKELLNVTCGNLLTALAGEEAVFEVCAPEAAVITVTDWKDMSGNEDTLFFNVDENPVLLRLSIESGEDQ